MRVILADSNELIRVGLKATLSGLIEVTDIVEINNYKLKGLSLVQIGKIYGCSNKLIHKYIKRHGK